MAIQRTRENLFRDCADPGIAIPSAACDRALAALEQAIVAERNPIVLLGPIGAGKTLLLRRIVERPPPFVRTVFLPWLNVPAEEVIKWIRAFEGAEGSWDDFIAAARASHARGVRTLLLVDEAQSMPRDCAERLAELVSGAGRAVQVILAGMDGRSLQAAVAVFQGCAEYVELAGQVTPQEAATWVQRAFGADQLSLLRDLDWADLVQKANGVPRLVRWEVERRLATGDLAAALRQEKGALRAEETPAARSEEAVALPAARPSPQVSVAAKSALPTHVDVAFDERGTILGRLSDKFRRLALWSREASRKAERVGRRHTLLLGQALSQAANQFRHAVPSRTENVGGLVIDRAEGIAARSMAALRNTRIWSAHYWSKLVLTGRRATPAIREVIRRIEIFLKSIVFRARRLPKKIALPPLRFIPQALAAVRGAAGRGAERASEFIRVRRLAFPSKLPGPKSAGALPLMPEMRVGRFAVFLIVAAVAFLLGRVTAPPIAGSGARELAPRPPPIVSSELPAAPLAAGQGQTIALQSGEGTESAHERTPEANPPPPIPAPMPHPQNALHTTPGAPKHVLVKIDAHPRARIWIDGHDVGRTPLGRVPLAPGRHNFQVTFADGRKIHRTLEIQHGTHAVNFH